MISSMPKSGTWANHYFLATLEALLKGDDTIYPYKNFFSFADDTVFVGVGHFTPDEGLLSPALVEKKYPFVFGYDYLQ